MAPGASQPNGSLFQDLWKTGTWRLMPLLLFYVTGLAIIAPNVPALMTNFMASRRAHMPLVCEDYLPAQQPQSCRNAYSDVVFWASASSFVSNSLLSFVMSPIVGGWSDAMGRKPFLIAAMAVGFAPAVVLVLNIQFGVSLFWYYPAQALGGAVSANSLSLAYVADMLQPAHRAAAFGTVLASLSLGILIGPAIGGLLDPLTASLVASIIGVASILYVLLLLPESLSPHAAAMRREQHTTMEESERSWLGMRILLRSSLLKKLTLCAMISGIASEGLQDLLFQYLKLKLAFGVKDFTLVFEIFGLCGMLVQTVVLRCLLSAVGEVHVMSIGLISSALGMLALALVTAKWQAFLAMVLCCLGGITFPTISSINANNVEEHEQGQIQGALYGARALSVGTGPIIFASVFAAFTRDSSPLPFFPGAPLLVGAALMTAAACVAASVPQGAKQSHALPLVCEDSEAEGAEGECASHLAGMTLPSGGMAAAEHLGELVAPLMAHHEKEDHGMEP